MATLFGKIAEIAILTIPGAVLKVFLKILQWFGQKLARAGTELVAAAIFYTGGWALWAIWVLAVWFGWYLHPKVQAVLPAAGDAWATGVLFVMAGGLLLWTTRRHRLAVRNRKALRELSGNVRGLRREWAEGMARATERTPLAGAFGSNRRRRAQRIEQQEARAAREAQEAAERAARDEYLDSLPPDHDPFEREHV